MKKRSENALAALFVLALLCLQGCQSSPQPQSQSANGTNSSNSGGGTASQQPGAPVTHLKVGDAAPDFTLTDTEGKPVKLSDFRGKKNVILAFYVLAFTGG